jgi:hypothetical protein
MWIISIHLVDKYLQIFIGAKRIQEGHSSGQAFVLALLTSSGFTEREGAAALPYAEDFYRKPTG